MNTFIKAHTHTFAHHVQPVQMIPRTGYKFYMCTMLPFSQFLSSSNVSVNAKAVNLSQNANLYK